MRLNGWLGVTTCVLLVPLSSASSQIAGGLGLGGGVGQLGTDTWLRELRLTPSARYSARAGFLRFDGAAVERAGSLSFERASLEGAASTPSFGAFRATLAGQYSRDLARIGPEPLGGVSTAISARRGAGGVWIGSSHAAEAESRLHAGLWRTIRSAVVSFSSRTQSATNGGNRIVTIRDSIPNDTTGGWNYYFRSDTTGAARSRRWSELEARLDWAAGRLVLSGALAASRDLVARRDSLSPARGLVWGHLNAAVVLNDRVSLTAGIGSLPAGIAERNRSSRFATLGLRFAPAALLRDPLPAAVRPAASAFSIRLVEPGTYKVVIRAPGARTVEISGDFNRWSPVAMHETAPNVWEATLALEPGTHRVNVRVDGDAWTAPPGLPSVNDEFNGRVGILVVK